MPMFSDAFWTPEVFLRKNAKACVLVFVGDPNESDDLRRTCSELDIVSTAEGMKVNIVFPIARNEQERVIQSLWDEYNPTGADPCFVFTTRDGTPTGVSLPGHPSVQALVDALTLSLSRQ